MTKQEPGYEEATACWKLNMASLPHFNERGFIRDLQSLADVILLDHSYAKPWSAHPDASKVRPVKVLFLSKEDTEKAAVIQGDDQEIDVCEPVLSSCSASIMYDTAKAKTVMAECEKYVSSVSSKKTPDTWEEQISRSVYLSPFIVEVYDLKFDRSLTCACDLGVIHKCLPAYVHIPLMLDIYVIYLVDEHYAIYRNS